MKIAICCLCGITLKGVKNCALVKCKRGHWNALVAVTLRKKEH